MSQIPQELRYIATHQWVRLDDDGVATVGITDFAQESLGDVVFVEIPELGSQVRGAEEAGMVESVKSASDVFSPVTGEVVAINEDLEDEPERINEDPYGEGWLFRVRISDPSELETLLDAEAYQAVVASEED